LQGLANEVQVALVHNDELYLLLRAMLKKFADTQDYRVC